MSEERQVPWCGGDQGKDQSWAVCERTWLEDIVTATFLAHDGPDNLIVKGAAMFQGKLE